MATTDTFDCLHYWLGIPPEDQPANHYRLLGIPVFETDGNVISHAADRQMAHVKTFQNGPHGSESQKLLNQISAARVCLLTLERKRDYDRQLKLTLSPKSPAPAVHFSPPALAMAPPPRVAQVRLAATAAEPMLRSCVDDTSPPGTQLPVVRRSTIHSRVLKRKKRNGGLLVALFVGCAALVVVLIAVVANSPKKQGNGGPGGQAGAGRNAQPLVVMFPKLRASVVRVDSDTGKFGSGVVLDDEGLVVTNYHVVALAKTIQVTLTTGQKRKVLGHVAFDVGRDLVILAVEPFKQPTAIKLARRMPLPAEEVVALGNPAGLNFSISKGIVSGIRPGEEVRKLMRGSFDKLGYDLDTVWIQHDAAISHGSSGGPLVSMQGELVGLNTWQRGKDLNFAVGIDDIRQLLEEADIEVSPSFENLPIAADDDDADDSPTWEPSPESSTPSGEGRPPSTAPKTAKSPQPKAAPSDPAIAGQKSIYDPFPSGRVFNPDVFEAEVTLQGDFNREDPSLVILRYPSGEPYAVAGQQRGQLHGVVIGRYEDKTPMVKANYYGGKRHRTLTTWDEAGRPAFFAEYLQGKRNGLLCLFDDGKPALIIEYQMDNLKCLRVISGDRIKVEFQKVAEADEDPATRDLMSRLTYLEEELQKNELAIKKQVRDIAKENRRKRAAELAPGKRAMAQAREVQRAAADAAFLQDLANMSRLATMPRAIITVPADTTIKKQTP